ncbi:MAG: FHA domain-containing protein [Deltaproteobacteria bacterium]|nr:FHA domain-containing protein [Deltaproteobacteria bacterium]
MTIPLTGDVVVIGRSAIADLVFTDDSLSRQHARLVRVGDEHKLEDLESRNGVFLNSIRIFSATLRTGDTIQLGELIFLYSEGIHS